MELLFVETCRRRYDGVYSAAMVQYSTVQYSTVQSIVHEYSSTAKGKGDGQTVANESN